MFGFKTLAAAATLAFGALSVLAAPAAIGSELVARCDCSDAPSIWGGLQANIQVHVDALTSITKEQCTPEIIGATVDGIKVEIAAAVVAINKLSGQSSATILAGVTVDAFVEIIAKVVISVFAAIRVVLDVCAKANLSVSVITQIFVSLGECLAALVSATISVCVGINVSLGALIYAKISVVIAVIVKLNIKLFLSVCGIVSL